MKKIFYIIISFILLSNINVYAIDPCTKEEEERLQKLADSVEIKYDHYVYTYNESEKQIYSDYNVNILNMDKDLKVYYKFGDLDEKVEFYDGDSFIDGSAVDFYVYSYTTNYCTNKLLRTIKINFPNYNRYYYFNKERCNDNPDFKYCKEYMNTSNIKYEVMENEFSSYVNQINNNVKKYNFNYIYIIILIIIIIVISSIFYIKRRKKNDDL